MSLSYYALLLTLGTIIIAIIIFIFFMFGNCGSLPWSTNPTPRSASSVRSNRSSSKWDLSPYSASSFKYRKGLLESIELPATAEEASGCVVCQLEFEDGDEVRQLQTCKHAFHAPCVDMWMYSHNSCPICRTPVDRRGAPDFTSTDNSSSMDALTDITISR